MYVDSAHAKKNHIRSNSVTSRDSSYSTVKAPVTYVLIARHLCPARATPPHQSGGHEPRPREHAVAELPHVVADGDVVAGVGVVHVVERALPHVVHEQLLDELVTHTSVHRHIPGRGH